MNKVCVKLKNCYGIKGLIHDFDFTEGNSYCIYAPNGFMKTSFSKTLNDLSKGEKSCDLVFPDRLTIREIRDQSNVDIKSESVFVVEPYVEDFASGKTSTLLASKEAKSLYDGAINAIEEKRESLEKKLKQLSGLTGKSNSIENEMLKCFNEKSVHVMYENLENLVIDFGHSQFSSISYSRLFNEKTLVLLSTGSIAQQLNDYIEKYDQLIQKSELLRSDFNHYHAKNITKSLSENGYFKAGHSVNLYNKVSESKVSSAEELDRAIEGEKQKILTDPELAKRFEAIDKKISNVELRDFRECLFENQDVIPQLKDFRKLQKDLIISYLASEIELYTAFLKEYKKAKNVIQESINVAAREKTAWAKIVDEFNQRFFVPFEVAISNQSEVILKKEAPQVQFIFKDADASGAVNKASLLKALSQGEKRALYILNILFEIKARANDGGKHLIVFDDIADSFDYKNKYAIIEFIREISRNKNFNLVILTHNYDFHRTICSRLDLRRDKKLSVIKNGRSVELKEEFYQRNPFDTWRNNLTTEKFMISAVPFVRNLAEYCGYHSEYQTLTDILHYKLTTKKITVLDLQLIYRSILKDKPSLVLNNPDRSVYEILIQTAESIIADTAISAELESKVVLSIAIRLMAEEYLINSIDEPDFVASIKKNQTRNLINKYTEKFPGNTDKIELLEQVNLMTPENIHLNAFMYEPILDMSTEHLKALYNKIKSI